MKNMLFAGLAAAVLVSSPWQTGYASARQSSGPVTFVNHVNSATMVHGTADHREVAGSVSTYRGNVVLAENHGRLQIHADDVVYDASTKEYVLKGNVRVSAR